MAWGRLALIQAAGESEDVLPKMALCFSYHRIAASKVEDKSRSKKQRPPVITVDDGPDEAGVMQKIPPARFVRIRRMMRKQEENELPASFLNDSNWRFTPEDHRREGTYQFSSSSSLLPMSRLTPFLLNGLGQQRPGARLDHRKLARSLATGAAIQRLPYLLRQRWSQRLLILVDVSARLEPYWSDFEFIVLQLRQQLGNEVVSAIRFDEERGDRDIRAVRWPPDREDKWFRWTAPTDNVPVLVLGDLGCGDSSGSARGFWRRVIQDLQGHGASLLTMSPWPHTSLATRSCRQLRPNPLNDGVSLPRHPARNGFDLRPALSRDFTEIFAWLSALPLIDSGLLRRLRLWFGWGHSELEGIIWNHAEIQQTGLGIRVHPPMAEKYRKVYQDRLAGSEQAEGFWALVEAHHRGAYEGLRQLEKLHRCVLERSYSQEVGDYLRQLAASAYQGKEGSGQHRALLMQCKTFLISQPDGVWLSELSDVAHVLYALAYKPEVEAGEWGEELPAGFDPEKVARLVLDKQQQLETEYWRIVQVDSEGTFVFRKGRKESGALLTTAVAEITSFTGLPPTLTFSSRDGGKYVMVSEGKKYFIEHGITGVESASHRLELDSITKPAWASRVWRDRERLKAELIVAGIIFEAEFYEYESLNQWVWPELLGEDQHGLYIDFEIKTGFTQRFRWIEPGTFMMGSPEDEKGRDNDEDLHQVTLTQGFWLADTTVTQALWEAVMDQNPSQFKDQSDNPVEQVSWEESQQFIQKLNTHIPDLQAQLPTEAQWEYACRAGTTAPFHFGGQAELNLERVNYSGQWNDNDPKGTTKPVKSYPCNDWGLYEMHGNVWEWCADVWQVNLGTEPVIDPQGLPSEGQQAETRRVVRGGSWFNGGRACRSAFRRWNVPDDRYFDLGFRLALGHAELKPGAGSAGSGTTATSRNRVDSTGLGSAVVEQAPPRTVEGTAGFARRLFESGKKLFGEG